MVERIFFTCALTLAIAGLMCLLGIQGKQPAKAQSWAVKVWIALFILAFWGMIGSLFAFIWR